jgi:murein tripeptide amidase MpaA
MIPTKLPGFIFRIEKMRQFFVFIFFTVIISCTFMTASAQSESKNVPPEWQTYSEKTEYRETPRYEETIAFSKKLDQASDLILYKSFGKSGEGRDLPLLIAATGKAFTPELARKQGKAVVFVQACIHAGESDGKDAGLALLRDIAITKTRADLLNDVVIVFVPIYNVDGHEYFNSHNRINQNGPAETGFRANATNLNLNRDYMKADAPETRAWLAFWNHWHPDFFIDCHVTDGADFRYNLTYEYAHFQEVSPFIKNWMDEHFDGKVVAKVESEGNLLTHYLEFNGRDVSKGVATFIATPRFATGYAALRNRAGLLIETHMLKPYKSRVRGTYDVLRYTIDEIGKSKPTLFEANKKAIQETIELGKIYDAKRNFPLSLEITENSKPFILKGIEYKIEDSEISGAKRIIYGTKPLDITIPQFDEAKISFGVAPPLYYIIPPQWKEVISVLQAHGIKILRTKKTLTIPVESYRLLNPKWSNNSFEGHLSLSFSTVMITEKRSFPVGSVIISLEQETANVVIHLLEPKSSDSLVYWGFFNSIFEQKEYGESYVVEELAREMLKNDVNLRIEFEQKLKDEKFAKNPSARLNFFYDHSRYFDKRLGVYPIGRVISNFKIDLNLIK